MNMIVIDDLDAGVELDQEALAELAGGHGYGYGHGKRYFRRLHRRIARRHGYAYPYYAKKLYVVKYYTPEYYYTPKHHGHYNYC